MKDYADKWWREPFSVFQTNLQEIDAGMDVDRALDTIEGHGADAWLINTGGILSFYPTDLPFQTRNPFLAQRASGDLIGDAFAAAKKRGIKVLARCDFSKVASPIAQENPDWLFVSNTGKPQVYNTLYTVCPSGDYYQHRTLDILTEIIERYPVDGFFFNWFGYSETDYSRVYHGVCHCANCHEKFAKYSGGLALPDGPDHPDYPLWMRFSNDVVEELSARISAHILTLRPDAGLILNRGAPLIYFEAQNAFGRDFWVHGTSEGISAHMTGLPEVSVLVNSVSFVDMPYRMAGEQPEFFAQYLLQAIARGGKPSTYIMSAPGRIPYPNLPLAGEITRFYKQHRSVYQDTAPASTVGVVRQEWVRRADPGYARATSELRGVYSALKEKHIPFDVIDGNLVVKMAQEGRLSEYTLLILPDLGPIGPETAKVLDAYVENGGRVILTGSSAVTPEGMVEMAAAPAIMRFGTSVQGLDAWASYVADTDQPGIADFIYAPGVLPVYGSYDRFIWKPGCERLGMYLPQAPFGPPEKCYGHIGSSHPAAAKGTHGKGEVLQIPWTIGHTYREFGTTLTRDRIVEYVGAMADVRVTADLPEQVELILGQGAEGLVIHLLNQSGARSRTVGPHIPVSGGRIRVKNATSARLLVSGEAPTLMRQGNDLLIELPVLELFEVIVVT